MIKLTTYRPMCRRLGCNEQSVSHRRLCAEHNQKYFEWYALEHEGEQAQEFLRKRKHDTFYTVLTKKCQECGEEYLTRRHQARYCSYRCIRAYRVKRQRERRKKSRQRICAICGSPFEGNRTDALYCKSSCRQKAYRQRVTDSEISRRRDNSTPVTNVDPVPQFNNRNKRGRQKH